jgi:hypothetical protein
MKTLRAGTFSLATLLAATRIPAQAPASGAIPNWAAPPTWSPSGAHRGMTTMDATPPLPFIGLNPCRVVDTRGNGFTGQYGPPALAAGASRNFDLAGQCGIPPSASAVSLNLTVVNASGAGDIRIYPGGGTLPLVSTLNYLAGQTIANAAVVGVTANAQISVRADVHGTHLVIDVNGYYASYPAGNGTLVVGITSDVNVPAILASSTSTTCFLGCGLTAATVSTNGGSAVLGLADGTTGISYAIRGHSASAADGTAAVLGVDRTRTGGDYAPAGVRGESSDAFAFGVLGIAQAQGVAGSLVDAGGGELAYGILGFAGASNYAVFGGGNFGGTGAKYFIEPHPTDASKVIRYISLEGPEAGTYFRGKTRIENGYTTIDVPEDFRMVTDTEGLSIQVTPIGEMASVAVMKIDLESIVVRASRDVEVFYTVNGVRRTHKDLKPIVSGTEFVPRSPDARIPAFLTEGQKAMLISNGTYREDGTVNMDTARRLGWDAVWERHPPQRVEQTPN